MNRVGCYVGKVDGIIGPMSKNVLKKLRRTVPNFVYTEEWFDSVEVLEYLLGIPCMSLQKFCR